MIDRLWEPKVIWTYEYGVCLLNALVVVGLNLSHLERFVPHWILNRSLVIICRKRQRAQRTFNEAVHRSFQMLMTEKFSDAPVGFELSLRIRCQGRNKRIQMRRLINPLLISCFPVCVFFFSADFASPYSICGEAVPDNNGLPSVHSVPQLQGGSFCGAERKGLPRRLQLAAASAATGLVSLCVCVKV